MKHSSSICWATQHQLAANRIGVAPLARFRRCRAAAAAGQLTLEPCRLPACGKQPAAALLVEQ